MLDHPGAIQVPTGALKWPKTAPKWPRLAQNHQNGSKWHCMTPNDPKTLPMGILHDYMSCWTTLGPFQRPTGAPKWPKTAPKMALHDPKCPCMTQNGPKTLPMGILDDIVSCFTTLGPFQRSTGAMWTSEKALGWCNVSYNHVLCP